MGAGRGTRLSGGRRGWWLAIASGAVLVVGAVLLWLWSSYTSWRATSRDLTVATLQWMREHIPGIPEISLFVAIAALIAPFFLARKLRQWNQQDTKDDRRSANGRPLMLFRVRDRWITVLERALENGPRIELGLARRQDLVRQPIVLVPAEVQRPKPLALEGSIDTIFRQIGGTLLLFGAPGAGKTIALLELTRELISVAESDERQPIPVVFNLASWASRRPPLAEWLVAELGILHQIPSAIAQRWVTSGEILPLLDGLDEVDEAHRKSCVEAINIFSAEELVKLVVVCRTQEYVTLSTYLLVDEAIELQSPTRQQVSNYLGAAGVMTNEIQEAARSDPSLWELLQSPLVLNIVALLYQNQPIGALKMAGTHQQRMTQLFGAYVEHMLAHRRGRYTQHRILEWLTWTARLMRDRQESEFHLDRLQPDWLLTATQQRIAVLGPAVVTGMVAGSVDGIIYGLLRGPINGAINGIAWGLFFGLFVGIRVPVSTGKRRFWVRIRRGARGGLILGSALWLLSSYVDALVAGLVFTLAFGLLAEFRKTEPVEEARRSRPKTGLGVVRGIAGGSIIGLLYGQSYGVVEGVANSLIFASSFAAACGLIGGLVTGLVPGLVENRMTPNEGVHRSARRALALGLPVGLLTGLIFALAFQRTSGMADGIGQGLRNGFLVGLAVALFYGGLACLQHFCVRSLLVYHQYAPARYVRFLDEAADRMLMRRAGSGYIFIHRLLLEYFSDLSIEDKRPEKLRGAQARVFSSRRDTGGAAAGGSRPLDR